MSKIIVIEIGHRANDVGAVSGGLRETDLTLTAGLEFKRQVERHGFMTFLNRVEWSGIPLVDFYAKSAAMNPAAGIAFHWNAGGGNGFECYTQTNGMNIKSIDLSSKIADEMKAITVMRPNPVRNCNTHPTPNGQNYTALINSVPAPFTYCEMGFIDNATDRARFDTIEKQKRYGVQAAKGVLKYLGVSWIEEGSQDVSKKDMLFRVQCGAFKNKENAEKFRDELRGKNYKDAFIAVGDFYRVQVGAFNVESNAVKSRDSMRKAGYTDAFITQS